GPTGGTGAQGLTWQGDFVPFDPYDQNDAVHFVDGSSYICVNPSGCAGSASPAGNPDWDVLAQAGDTGPTGPTGQTGATGASRATGPPGPAGPSGVLIGSGSGNTNISNALCSPFDGGTKYATDAAGSDAKPRNGTLAKLRVKANAGTTGTFTVLKN